MAFHMEKDIEDVDEFEDETLENLGLIPEIESRYRSTYFGHIFAGGYSAGILQLSLDRSIRGRCF